jgi:hypothetical protein
MAVVFALSTIATYVLLERVLDGGITAAREAFVDDRRAYRKLDPTRPCRKETLTPALTRPCGREARAGRLTCATGHHSARGRRAGSGSQR